MMNCLSVVYFGSLHDLKGSFKGADSVKAVLLNSHM